MKKSKNNISITRSILAIVIIATLFLAAIGGIGYFQAGNINNNISQMHKEVVQRSQLVTEFTHKFMDIRVEVLRVMDLGAVPSIFNNIDELDKELRALMEDYAMDLDEESMNYTILQTALNNYNQFMETWAKAKTQLTTHEDPSDEVKLDLEVRANGIQNNFRFIIDENEKMAEELYYESINIYEKGTGALIISAIVALIVLLGISFIIIGVVKRSIGQMDTIFESIARGDFTIAIDTDQRNEFGLMKKSLHTTLQQVSNMIDNVKISINDTDDSASSLASICEQMTAASQEVASAIQEIAKGSNKQVVDLDRMVNIINNFSRELEEAVLEIQDIYESTQRTDVLVSEGNSKLQELINSTRIIGESFNEVSEHVTILGKELQQIEEITNAINSISEQTNLLALNAAIEAARAGEAGRGFAVVAEEIRKLAEQSRDSSEHIEELISKISRDSTEIIDITGRGVEDLRGQEEVVNNTIESFKEILGDIGDIIPKIESANKSVEIANESKKEIILGIDAISLVAEDNSAITQEIAASSEEMSASSEEVASTAETLNNMTHQMRGEVERFRV